MPIKHKKTASGSDNGSEIQKAEWNDDHSLPASSEIPFDNAVSGLTADNVKSAIEEVNVKAQTSVSYRVDVETYGLLSRAETTIAFNDGTGIFTITPTGTTWNYYRSGVKHTVTGAKSTDALPAATSTPTIYHIYLDGTDGTLTVGSAWTLYDTKVPVATVTRCSTLTPTYLLADERHTVDVSRALHREGHFDSGTQLRTVPTLTGPTVNSTTAAQKTVGLTGGQIDDDGLLISLSSVTAGDGTTQSNYTVAYRNASTTNPWLWQRSLMPFRYTGAGNIEYDNAGTMTACTGGRWVNYYLLACNVGGQEQYLWIPGRAQFTSAATAYAESFSTFSMVGAPVLEGVAVYQFTWEQNGTAGAGNCRLSRTPVRVAANIVTTGTTSTTAHNLLSGLDGGATGEYYHLTAAQHAVATQAASATVDGYVTTGAQTFAGAKTFNGGVIADVTGTASGNLTSSSVTDSAITGKLITGFSSGSGTVAGTDTILQAINKLDGNIAGKMAAVTPSTSGNVLTSNGSVWTSAAPTGMANPMTTSGDVIYGGTSGAPTRLAAGSNGQVLTLASGVPSWSAPALAATQALGSISTATDVDFNSGNYVTCTMTANIAFTLVTTNMGSNPRWCWLAITQDGTGSRVFSYGGTRPKSPGNLTPVLTTTASKLDILEYFWDGSAFILHNAIFDVRNS